MRLMHGVDFVSLAKPRAMFATVTYDKFARDQSKHTSWVFLVTSRNASCVARVGFVPKEIFQFYKPTLISEKFVLCKWKRKTIHKHLNYPKKPTIE